MGEMGIVKRHILIVDDEPLLCETLSMILRFEGHAVDEAGSGKQALAMFAPGKFDLVMTDFFMPAMTGGDLAKAIKASAPGQPVVLLTAYAERFRSPARSLIPVDSIIEKPILIDVLRETIAGLSPA
jgi:CheY-like chemotaxis protein